MEKMNQIQWQGKASGRRLVLPRSQEARSPFQSIFGLTSSPWNSHASLCIEAPRFQFSFQAWTSPQRGKRLARKRYLILQNNLSGTLRRLMGRGNHPGYITKEPGLRM